MSKINLTINKGDRLGIIGKTGSGKSTLVDLIMGLLTPDSGQIIIDGKDLSKPKNIKSGEPLSLTSHKIYILQMPL